MLADGVTPLQRSGARKFCILTLTYQHANTGLRFSQVNCKQTAADVWQIPDHITAAHIHITAYFLSLSSSSAVSKTKTTHYIKEDHLLKWYTQNIRHTSWKLLTRCTAAFPPEMLSHKSVNHGFCASHLCQSRPTTVAKVSMLLFTIYS
jgi:hypothetical protein